VAGDLYIGGAGLALGYWRDEGKTRERFVTHPSGGGRLYLTGDIGRYRPDGNIELLGREDLQVKVGGYRVELGEVEAALAECEGVESVAVVAFTNGSDVRQLAAFYTGAAVQAQELRGQLKARLPHYMLPSAWRRLDAMPLTPNGKLDRRALEKLAAADKAPRPPAVDESRRPAAARAPAGDLRAPAENALAKMLSEPGVLREPEARSKFVGGRKGVRADLEGAPRFPLDGAGPAALAEEFRRRRSSRGFDARKLGRRALSSLLGRLRGIASGERVKYLFPSAGGAYGVQTYVAVKPDRFEDFAEGVYYYHPLGHELRRTSDAHPLSVGLHAPVNQRLFAEAGFSLFLVADLRAVEPLYGSLALDFARLEAGYMGQVLVEAAAPCGLGLCPIGYLDFDPVRPHFGLDGSHVLLHSFVAGAPARDDADEPLIDAAGAFAASPRARVEAGPQTFEPPRAEVHAKENGRPARGRRTDGDARLKLIEDEIADAWAEALQGDRPGADESFFEMGGNSFTAVAVQQYLARLYAVPLSVTDLFRFPTVRELARYVYEAEGHTEEAAGRDAPPSPPAPQDMSQAPGHKTRGDVRRAIRSRVAGRREQGGGV
jgi:SagB-type dehydrogenase family enzyme